MIWLIADESGEGAGEPLDGLANRGEKSFEQCFLNVFQSRHILINHVG